MAGGSSGGRQKKSSSSSSFFGFFKSSKSSRATPARRMPEEVIKDHHQYHDQFMKAYKVYPSDEDRGRWVAEPGIDRKASAYISSTTDKWKNVAVAN